MDVFNTNCDEQADAQAFRPMTMQRRATELSPATKNLIKSLPNIEIPFRFSSKVVREVAASSLSGVLPSPVVGRSGAAQISPISHLPIISVTRLGDSIAEYYESGKAANYVTNSNSATFRYQACH